MISIAVEFAQTAFAADIDGDGDQDVLSASAGDDKIAWYENEGDGVGGACDNCPAALNGSQADADGDSVGDACGACAGFDDSIDSDDDSIANGCDNCPGIANTDQADGNGDGVGDACTPPPEISVRVIPELLWPPDSRMVQVTAEVVATTASGEPASWSSSTWGAGSAGLPRASGPGSCSP